MKTRITRKTLRKLVEQAISETPALGPKQKSEIRSTAASIKEISLGKWIIIGEECGCIVGTLLGYKVPDYNTRLRPFGVRFDELLSAYVENPGHYGIVRVTA